MRTFGPAERWSVVWKQALPVQEDDIRVMLPQDAEVLSVQTTADGETPAVWFRCDPKAAPTPRIFTWTPTGVEFRGPEGMRFVGTVQVLHGGAVEVHHLWELPVATAVVVFGGAR